MLPPTLETPRLVLRAAAREDWEPYAAMWADPRVTRFIGGEPRPRDLAWTKFVQGAGFWPLFGYGFWSIIDRTDGAYLGVGGFARFERGIDALHGYPEAGWTLVPAAWGRGIASEALAAMLGWTDADGPAETRCMIDDANAASVRVATRNGYAVHSRHGDDAHIFTRRAPSS